MPWLIARTKSNQEAIAARHCRLQQCPVYLPTYFDRRLKRRRVLFPSYLMVRTVGEQFSFLNSTIGILCLLRNGDKPAELDQSQVDKIKARENIHGNVMLDDEEPLPEEAEQFQIGETVKVSGPIEGLGIYQGMGTKGRVLVLMGMLGASRNIQVSRRLIQKAA